MLNSSDLKQFLNLSQLSENRVQRLCKNGKIERRLAEDLISYSTFWDHPSGDCVLAKGHSKRIYIYKDLFLDKVKSEEIQSLFVDRLVKMNDWAIEFGYNTFMIGRAVHNFQGFILQKIQEKEREIQNISELIEATFDGVIHSFGNGKSYYNGSSYLQFGSTFIDKVSFVRCLFRVCALSAPSKRQTQLPSKNKKFKQLQTLQGNKNSKGQNSKKPGPYQCGLCLATFQSYQELHLHKYINHPWR